MSLEILIDGGSVWPECISSTNHNHQEQASEEKDIRVILSSHEYLVTLYLPP